MLALSCFFISAKLNSTHYGGAEFLLRFYYNERPRSNKINLLEFRDPKLKEGIESELFRIEFEVLKTLNFQFTQFNELPLNLLRSFITKI